MEPIAAPPTRRQDYILEARPHPSLLPSSTEFKVVNQPFDIHLTLRRAHASLTLIFRAAAGTSTAARGSSHWTSALTVPRGMRFEVLHKATGLRVAAGAIQVAEVTPRVSLASEQFHTMESYSLRVLEGHSNLPSFCDFIVEAADAQVLFAAQPLTMGSPFLPSHRRCCQI